MMGGFGSGRPSGFGRNTVESCRSLDINKLHREGCLKPGWTGGWQWTSEGKQTAWISLSTRSDRIRLSYKVRVSGGEWQDVEQDVRIEHEPCRFGGSRAYFVCPGVVNDASCEQRAVKLHGAGRYFLCRHCYRLAYASQGEDVFDRTRRRAHKIRSRLGGDANMLVPFPRKPKGMWNSTYAQLRTRAIETEFRADIMFEIKAAGLINRIERVENKRRFW